MTGYQTKTVAVGALISAALAVLGWFIGAQPQLDNASKYKQEAVAATQAADQVRANIGQLKQKEAGLPAANREYSELARQFPHKFEGSEWASMISSAARSSGVKLEELSPSIPQVDGAEAVAPGAAAPDAAAATPPAPSAAGNLASSSVTITASGSSAQVRGFVERLGKLPRPILISSMSISDDGGSASKVTLSGTTYMMRELLDPNSPQARAAAGQPSGAAPTPGRPNRAPKAPAMPEVK